jgi:hypothetical protein
VSTLSERSLTVCESEECGVQYWHLQRCLVRGHNGDGDAADRLTCDGIAQATMWALVRKATETPTLQAQLAPTPEQVQGPVTVAPTLVTRLVRFSDCSDFAVDFPFDFEVIFEVDFVR